MLSSITNQLHINNKKNTSIIQEAISLTTECHWHLIYFPLTYEGIRHGDINTCVVADTQIPELLPVTAHTSGLSSIL